MSSRTVVVGVDIGGTKVKAAAVEVGLEGIGTRVAAFRKIATPRVDPPAFYDAIAELVRGVSADARRAGCSVFPLMAVAHPGRFLPTGVLARGTTPNLGTIPNQFDGHSPAAELARRLSAHVVAENDAVAQMRFGLDALLRDPAIRPHLLGEVVVYLGPGTGMGGGVARVSQAGGVTVETDGHFFDLQLSGYGDGRLTAEELFTGPAIARRIEDANTRLAVPIDPPRAETLSRLLAAPEGLPEHRAEAERIAEACGQILALIIETIHAGTVRKVRLETAPDGRIHRHVDEPDRAWSAHDQAIVRGVRRVILGGSVGGDPAFGSRLQAHALEVLRQRGLTGVRIDQIPVPPEDAGLLGVLKAIPLSEIRGRGGG